MKDIIYDGVAFKVLEEWPNYAVRKDGRVVNINYKGTGRAIAKPTAATTSVTIYQDKNKTNNFNIENYGIQFRK